ncbi:hypothetical protein NZ043_27445 [Paenibacillus sp. FSL k6-2145]|uniref:hypothetical protein n=1 Tax=Paenibacillus sp. FSL k6-2145 TaxID=2976834 RepID=UPI0030DD1A26
MKDQLYIRIIINYTESAKALRENTAAVMSFNGSVQGSDFEALWRERDMIYHRWQNAAASLRELPMEYMSLAISAIDHI